MYNAVLIGYGYWGPNIAKNLSKSADFNLYGICDLDEGKIAKAKDLYGDKIKYYSDYNEVIKDNAVDACAVALRNDIGQKVARAVLKAGKHLFMEKPMATSMDDALTLKRLAGEKNLIIHVDHILVYHPIIRRIKNMIENGEIGELISFESNRANLGPHIKQDMNAMWDLAVHDLAILDYLSGGHNAKKISCIGTKHYGEQEITTYLTIGYENFAAMIKSSWFSPLKERNIVISGTKKMIVFDDLLDEKLMIYDKGIDLDEGLFSEYGKYEAKVRTGDIFIPSVDAEDSLLNSLTHFADCIRNKRSSISGPDQAIRVLDILCKADESLKELR